MPRRVIRALLLTKEKGRREASPFVFRSTGCLLRQRLEAGVGLITLALLGAILLVGLFPKEI